MRTTRKIALGLGLAGGAFLTAYLLSGDRKKRTQQFLVKGGRKLKEVLRSREIPLREDQDFDYA